MTLNIHIQHVERLVIGGGSGCSSPPARRAEQQGANESAETPRHIAEIRARLNAPKPCDTCGGTGMITWNPLDEVGDFRTEACPKCRKARAA